MSRLSPHRIGETIAGRYRLISPLGEGGFGVAYRAWDEKSGVPVVLKMPLAKHLDRPVVIERFEREVVRLRQCSHPNIVPIIDDGRDDQGRPFLVMRFLPGGSLADRKKPVGAAVLHRWLPGVAAALDYIHGQGVLHRDVKPANIFFDTQATAFLGDFGIAKLVDEQVHDEADRAVAFPTTHPAGHDLEESLTRTGSLIGTYAYMAPELFADQPQLTPQADQYSLAVAVYEMLCGQLPVVGTEEMLRTFHRTEKQPSLTSRRKVLPESLSVAVDKALGKRPDERFRKCEEFAAAVLTDVPFTPVDPSHYRFLCPACKRLVRVPEDFGGRSCRCPEANCNVVLRVSPSLDALWRREESPEGGAKISLLGTPARRIPTKAQSVHDQRVLVNAIGIELKLLPAGTFIMGQAGGASDEKPHQVLLTAPFYIGAHEVTNAQWKQVMGSSPSEWKHDDRPVENVNWYEAVEFCKRLSSLPDEQHGGRVYRLPTEAEWEYACRAGERTLYAHGDDQSPLVAYAWFGNNSGSHPIDVATLWNQSPDEYFKQLQRLGCQTHPVGRKKPNAWGLYDMHGNLWEWCSDWYGEYSQAAIKDPQGPTDGSFRVVRGGSWYSPAAQCRSAFRSGLHPSDRAFYLGFRVAMSPT